MVNTSQMGEASDTTKMHLGTLGSHLAPTSQLISPSCAHWLPNGLFWGVLQKSGQTHAMPCRVERPHLLVSMGTFNGCFGLHQPFEYFLGKTQYFVVHCFQQPPGIRNFSLSLKFQACFWFSICEFLPKNL